MVAAGDLYENDVVFVIEGTANLLLDFETLRKSYIEPAIQWVWFKTSISWPLLANNLQVVNENVLSLSLITLHVPYQFSFICKAKY